MDRKQLVRRHNPVLTDVHPTAALTVGNGEAALTVDASGLQTFPEFHELRPDPRRVPRDGLQGLPPQRPREFDVDDFQIPLRTQSTWGWYETTATRNISFEATETLYETARGSVPYPDRMGLQRAADPISEEFVAGAWLHYNPRRAHLGRLALVDVDGRRPEPSELRDIRTELDLWSGSIHATYELDGERVAVTTVADPVDARFAVRIESALLARGWGIAWVFDSQPDDLAWFEEPLDEATAWSERSAGHRVAERRIGRSTYAVDIRTDGALASDGQHGVIAHGSQGHLEVVVTLSSDAMVDACDFASVETAAAEHWRVYWERGAMVSLQGSEDVRAIELERRIVLSQYLLAVNSAGSMPPAETGLTYNTWTGKFHLEMHWWHAAHFALWGRGDLLERSLPYYHRALDAARGTARRQGYRGARWPKHTDPSARESPSNIGVFLVWQQPHIIHLLELLWQEGRDEAFLLEHYTLVEQTAEFMVDFVEQRDGRFHLPAPLIPAQESYLVDRATTEDPTFELAYWSWALGVANEWRERLGLPADEEWQQVADGMALPTVLDDGTYAAVATPPHLIREDHPSMLMALGWLPDSDLIDPDVMSATLDSVWEKWDLPSTWGWDYPVMAMAAARLGDLDRAIDALLMRSGKNVYLPNGHNPQMPGFLSLYLPANGGLLAAIAHIVDAIERGAAAPAGIRIDAEGLHTQTRLRSRAAAAF
ncbi:hypothetical protein SRABI76_01795 [Microbacterium oxydans]|uniref:hypothetical protein n=1 Tax=Microbacterium oxydans TaxID=82380 RepID=UPI001D779B99|nr:hypothetical protein [Microbacterium oxydans]CAH0191983.1 hypothetical protein SRABI76_01795 [Microbacterium oxydans]